jgi:uncharacterized protein involved in outer membrane biogenesis
MKWIARILIVLVLLAALPALFGNRLVERYAVRAIKEQTGFTATVGGLKVGVVRPVVHITDLVLENPEGFPDAEALTVREVFVHYDRWSLLGRQPHLREVRIDIPRVVMVRPEQGPSNVEILAKAGQREPATSGGEKAGGAAGGGAANTPADGTAGVGDSAPLEVRIDTLTVKLGEMEVRSFRRGQDAPVVLNVPVGMDRTYQGVTNLQQVGVQISSELVVRSGVGLLGQLDQVIQKIDGKSDKVADRLNKALKGIQEHFQQPSE